MALVVDNEHSFKATSWEKDFPKVIEVPMPERSKVVDVHCTGIDVTLFVREPVLDVDEIQKTEIRTFHLYKTGKPYREPSRTKFKFLGIFGANEGKCAIYEER